MIKKIVMVFGLSVIIVSGCSDNSLYIPNNGEKVIVTINAPLAVDKKTLEEVNNYIEQNNNDALKQLSNKEKFSSVNKGEVVSVKDVHKNEKLIEVMDSDGFEGVMDLRVIEETLKEGEDYYLTEGSYFFMTEQNANFDNYSQSLMAEVVEKRNNSEEKEIEEMYDYGKILKLTGGDLKVKLLKLNEDGTVIVEYEIEEDKYDIYSELNSLSDAHENKGNTSIEYNALKD
ncbi:hypothetical protein [Bacillus sp. B1-b2]|uniref:hypothetical protein n=1 Tax=Bacillus sp. B1-b2 TaxID=2653201 RepID=UPI001261B25B|nr:hypothetical protein [Bacillus sp. B1-b2]KAB7663383.1 hypothetical protein F9279_24110 [Bacillus sp. B1-b2]